MNPIASRPLRLLVIALMLLATSIPSTTRADEPPDLDSVAPDFTLSTLDNQKVVLSKVAANGPVVLVVLRGYPGYQCPICTAQVAALLKGAADLRNAGARVLLVYPGPAAGDLKAHAREFLATSKLPDNFSFLLDPDYTFTNAYHLRWDAPSETAYPSTFVLDKDRKVVSSRVSKTHSGRASLDEILRAVGFAK
jgi:peroxiredoxin Q/BCP